MLLHLGVFAAGLVAGFLNVMAGGGSLITLPILIFMGLPVAVANGTNRFAILVQNVAALASFRQQGYDAMRSGIAFALITIPGAIAGALVAIRVSEGAFRAILAGVLVLSVVGLLVPGRPRDTEAHTSGGSRGLAFVAFFAVGFYGGFIQASVGFLIILTLHKLLHMDLVQTNMHKVLIILVFSLPALAVFIVTGNVAWTAAGALAAGTGLGGLVAARVSVRGGERLIRFVIGIALLLMAVRLVS
ncbi:MAG: sulfite exporter TauE/SafE family protein [Gemmatimonadota bacterium]|nr:MAG: sulfite exporter TauE/SafE family protein [Gemmatimonadota bacterium]